ncbi:hypothetical protein ACT7GF_000561 [Campylobacter upsaliensis]
MVLEDDLAEELCNFRNNEIKKYEINTIERILHYYKPLILLRSEYIRRYYKDKAILRSILSNNAHINFDASLEELAKKTIYKIILSKDKDNFPYVNILNDKIENNLTTSFDKNEDRKKAKEHLKALFLNANYLFVYDKFINNNQEQFIEFVKECFPKKSLKIFYPIEDGMKFPNNLCSGLKNIYKKWSIVENKNTEINKKYDYLHDRYIIVDNEIQIILTSGIDNLMDIEKDFTYIIREL